MTELFQNIQSVYRKWEEKSNPKVSSLYLTPHSNDEDTAVDNNKKTTESISDDNMTVENRNFENQLRSAPDGDHIRTLADDNLDRRQRRTGNGGYFSNRFTRSSRFRLPVISLVSFENYFLFFSEFLLPSYFFIFSYNLILIQTLITYIYSYSKSRVKSNFNHTVS